MNWVDRLSEIYVPDGKWIEPLGDTWWRARRGRISASSRANTLATVKASPWSNLMAKLNRELEEDYQHIDVQGVDSLDWGRKNELRAIANIELKLGVDIVEPGMMFHPRHVYCEATPDGLIDNEITVEIKCPIKQEVHQAVLYDKDAIKRLYRFQTQFAAWVAGAKQALFCSFDPRCPAATQLAIIEIKPDLALQDTWEENLTKFRKLFETGEVLGEGKVSPMNIPLHF